MTTEKKVLKYKNAVNEEQKRQSPYPHGISFSTTNSLNLNDSEDVSHIEKRTAHNALERQRREGLNTKFQELAHVLPSLQQIRRPSKSMIVTKSLEFVTNAIARESQYKDQLKDLRKENEQLRRQASLASKRLKNLRRKSKLDDTFIEKPDDALAAASTDVVEAGPSSSETKKQIETREKPQSSRQQESQQKEGKDPHQQETYKHPYQTQNHHSFPSGMNTSTTTTVTATMTTTTTKRQRDDYSPLESSESSSTSSNTKRKKFSVPFQHINQQQQRDNLQYHIDFNINQAMPAHGLSFASYHNMVYPPPPPPPSPPPTSQMQTISASSTPVVRYIPSVQYTYDGIHLIPGFIPEDVSDNNNNNQDLFWNE